MDACHILLAQPCQFDLQTIHKGRENAYEFLWMGKKIVLLPTSKNMDKGIVHIFESCASPPFLIQLTLNGWG